MNESETFIARWSRLKREKGRTAATDPVGVSLGDAQLPSPVAHEDGADSGATETRVQAPCELAAFDPARLPPIESITSGTDMRAFLQVGVPAELVKSALRRAWASDPAVRDFIEVAENQWDFTDPTSVPGFGPIETAGDVHEMMTRVVNCMRQVGTSPVQAPSADAAPSSPQTPVAERWSAHGKPTSAPVSIPTSCLGAGEAGVHSAPFPRGSGDASQASPEAKGERAQKPHGLSHGSALPR